MLSYIRKFFTSSSQKRKIFFESIWLSIKYEYFLRTNSFDPIKHLHNLTQSDEELKLSQEDIVALHHVSKVIDVLEKFAFWKPKCYNRAMTAKKVLLKRGINTVMHIGFRKKDNQFDGHAWLTCNNMIVTGKVKGLNTFKQLHAVKPSVT